jgi:hypothetical protein
MTQRAVICFQLRTMRALIFYPALRRDARIEGVLDHGHLGDGIGDLNDFCRTTAARYDNVYFRGTCA